VITPDNKTLYYSTTYRSVQITKNMIGVVYEFNDPDDDKLITSVKENWAYDITASFNIWDNTTDYTNKRGENVISTTHVKVTSNTIPADIYGTVYASLKETLTGTIVDDN